MNKRKQEDFITAMRDWIREKAYCACCEGILECADGCTIQEDSESAGGYSLDGYHEMLEAREILNMEYPREQPD